MSEGSLSIELDRHDFEPGEMLRGQYQLVTADPSRLKEVEITVGWHTEGKGTEARGIEHRAVHPAGDGSLDRGGVGTFSAVLPASPLSYDGPLIKIGWTVRVRARFSGWGHLDAEEAFQLGHVSRVVMRGST